MMPDAASEDGVHAQLPPHVSFGIGEWYLPAAQSVQVLDANAEYLPAPQSMQVLDAANEYLPAGQLIQVLSAVAPRVSEYLPAAQTRQEEAPSSFE